jgi:hypothetical protein
MTAQNLYQDSWNSFSSFKSNSVGDLLLLPPTYTTQGDVISLLSPFKQWNEKWTLQEYLVNNAENKVTAGLV